MSNRRSSRFERLLETTARRVGGNALHPLELLQRVQEAVEATRSEGKVANDIRIALSPGDFDRFRLDLDRLRGQVNRMLDALERRERLERLGERRVHFESSDAVAAGLPVVTARFAHTGGEPGVALAAGATRRLARQTGFDLVFADGSRVPLTHTPFTIGRGPGNDLVLADLAVSLNHAEVRRAGGRFVVHDRGSRNGVLVDGARAEADAPLAPGATVTLGGTTLRLEAADG